MSGVLEQFKQEKQQAQSAKPEAKGGWTPNLSAANDQICNQCREKVIVTHANDGLEWGTLNSCCDVRKAGPSTASATGALRSG